MNWLLGVAESAPHIEPWEYGLPGAALMLVGAALYVLIKILNLKFFHSATSRRNGQANGKDIAKAIELAMENVSEAALRAMKDHFAPMVRQIDDLYGWHDVTDEDGVRVWYLRRSLEKAINRLADVVEKSHQLTQQQVRLLEQLCEESRRHTPPSRSGG